MNRKTILGIALIIIAFWSYTQVLFQVKATPTYYGTFLNSNMIESNGLIRKWSVNNSTNLYLYNGNIGFFSVTKTGTGLSDVTILDDSTGYKLNQITGIKQYVDIKKDYSPSLNTASYTYYNLTVYGYNTGIVNTIYYWTDSYGHNYGFQYTDNFNGLREYTHTQTGTLMEFTIDVDFGVGISTGKQSKIISLELTNPMPTYYQIWDGSTLKYQGLINPDINDFITDTPTFTATNTIQLNTVYIAMGIGIIGALVSLGVFWIGLISIAIDLTILWNFLFDAKVVTGYSIASNNQIITLVETYSDLRLFCVLIFIFSLACIIIGAYKYGSE